MRIVQVTEWFPDYAARATLELSKRLSSLGHEVWIVSSDFDQTGLNRYRQGDTFVEGLRVRRLPSKPTRILGTQYVFYSPKSIENAHDFIRRLNPDILCIQSYWGMLGLACLLSPSLRRIPKTVTIHGIISGYKGIGLRFVAALLNCFSQCITSIAAQRILSVSRLDIPRIESWGVDRDKIEYVPNGVDSTKFAPVSPIVKERLRTELGYPKDRIVVLFLAYLRAAKGVDVFLDAIEKARRIDPDLFFVIAGDGPLKDYVRTEIESSNLGVSVRMLGFVEEELLPSVYASTDIYVLPSFLEGMPVSLLQAMSCGLPVIATPVGDVPEIVKDDVNGIIVNVGSSLELSEAIVRLGRDAHLRDRMGAASRKTVVGYDLDSIAKTCEGIYQTVRQESAKSRRGG
jgi:glycosyltransferase involved in cell wall biosynthesis